MGGPGSGPRKKGEPKKGAAPRNRHKKKREKTLRESAGYEGEPEPYVPRIFPRNLIDEYGVFDDPDRKQTFPRTGSHKYEKELITNILDEMANGASIIAVCDAFGLGERTFHNWMQTRADFKTLVTMAEGMISVLVDKHLIHLGLDWDDTTALIMHQNAHAKRYGYGKSEQLDVNIQVGGTVDVNHLLRSPESRAAISTIEAGLQNVIEGEIVKPKQLPEHLDATPGDES